MGANVWLLKGYFDTVPREIDEAAIVDGAGHARIFFTMHLLLITPILITVGMIAFVAFSNEFLLASKSSSRTWTARPWPWVSTP